MKEATPFITPDGYKYKGQLFEDLNQRFEKRKIWLNIAWANILALIPLGLGILILWFPYQLYLFYNTPLAIFPDPTWPTAVIIAASAGSIIASIFLHELIHGMALKISGHHPQFNIHKGFPITDIPQGHFLTRLQYLVMALAPVVLMTATGGVTLILLPPFFGKILLATLLLNMAASVGDLFVAGRVWLAPAEALFATGKDILVFVPEVTR